MRLVAYTDHTYRREDGALFAEMAFAIFLSALSRRLDALVLVGRLDPAPGRASHRLPRDTDFVGLPFYPEASGLADVLRALPVSANRFWSTLGRVEGAWLQGPHPLALLFALLTLARRKRLILGVRTDYPAYVRNRHPGRPFVQRLGLLLDRAWRTLARRHPVVVVGPGLAKSYGHAPWLLEITVSTVDESDIVAPPDAVARTYNGELQVLSVARLDPEKNPLLLADVLKELCAREDRWRLVVCGDGTLKDALAERLTKLGVAERARLHGYVPLEAGLLEIYRSSHALLHVSWTEGFPQVVLEGFAAGLPVVATAVGGVEAVVGRSALLIPPGDAGAAADALTCIAADEQLRHGLVRRGHDLVCSHTLERECARVAEFIDASFPRRRPGADGRMASPRQASEGAGC